MEYKDIIHKSYITEIAFYIGTISWIDNLIKKELINKIDDEIDGIVIFYLFVKFLENRFSKMDTNDVYEYIDSYVETDLKDFIKENFN